MVSEHDMYDYETTDDCEISYIDYYLKSLPLYAFEGQVVHESDGKSFLVVIKYEDGSKYQLTMGKSGIIAGENHGYSISINNYNHFLTFINALKSKKLFLSSKIDFALSDWAKSDIKEAIEIGLVPHWNQNNYQKQISRLEVCQLIECLMENYNIIDTTLLESPFLDVDDKSVSFLYKLGIVYGKTEKEFYPYVPITREEFARILSGTYQLVKNEAPSGNIKVTYIDQNDISQWAIDSVMNMTSVGLLKGYLNGQFQPLNNITKEEVIVTLLRMKNR